MWVWCGEPEVLSGCGIASQNLHHAAVLPKCSQSRIRGCQGREADVDVEDVLPGAAGDGSGFDLCEVDACFGETLERRDESSGAVLDGEGEAHLVCSGDSLIVGWGVFAA